MGKPKMIKVSKSIAVGARSFLNKQYILILVLALSMFACMIGFLYNGVTTKCQSAEPDGYCNPYLGNPGLDTLGVFTGLCFLTGCLVAAFASFTGVWIAAQANVRTCWACNDSINSGLKIAFKSGSVMGLATVCFGLMGLQICYLILSISTVDQRLVWQYLSGYAFGISMAAIFARVAGGVFAKATDVGVDLVTKIEPGIPDDSANNAGVIASHVGSNLSSVSGVGLDLMDSFIGAMIAACSLGYETYGKLSVPSIGYCCLFGIPSPSPYTIPTNYALASVAYPFWLAGVGLISSLLAMYVVRTSAGDGMDREKVAASLWNSVHFAVTIALLFYTGLACLVSWMIMGNSGNEWRCFGCTLLGVYGGQFVCFWTSMHTSTRFAPSRSIAKKGNTGVVSVIMHGLSLAMSSTAFPLFVIGFVLIASGAIQAFYGIAIAAISVLSIVSIHIAVDAYAPVAATASGIAEMCQGEVKDGTRDRVKALEGLGVLVAARGRGYATIGAAFTTVPLIGAYLSAAGLYGVALDDSVIFAGLFIGVLLVFFVSALAMASVSRNAEDIVSEVREQFSKEPRLRDVNYEGAEGVPNYEKTIARTTQSALLETIIPGSLAVFVPFVVGYLLGSRCLAGVLVGSVTAGSALAFTLTTSGSTWESANGYAMIGGKGSSALSSAYTLGGPFKDVAGPAVNVFMKMMTLFSIVIAPSLKHVNASGSVFPNHTFWIGIIIWVVEGSFLVIFNYFLVKRYNSSSEMMEKLQAENGGKMEASAPATAETAPMVQEATVEVPETVTTQ